MFVSPPWIYIPDMEMKKSKKLLYLVWAETRFLWTEFFFSKKTNIIQN